MGAKNKTYEVFKYTGVPVENDASGNYIVKQNAKPNIWRTGKHTKGKFNELGQIFLTENNLPIAVTAAVEIPFKQRHEYTPMQRWTTAKADITGWVE